MNKTKTKNPTQKFLTPVGTFAYPWIDKPSTNFDPDGVYQADVVLPPGGALDKFRAELEEFGARAAVELGHEGEADIPIKPHKAKDPDGNKVETGDFAIRTKLKAVTRRPDAPPIERRPKVVDAKTKPIVPVPKIGGGTKGRIAGQARASVVKGQLYVTLYMDVVQIVELVQFGDRDPAEFGMGEIEGYSVEAVDETSSDGPDY